MKSMGGEPVEEFRLDGRGVAGDRTHAVYDEFKGAPRRLTARETPRLLAWRASYPPGDIDPEAPPEPTLSAPDGRSLEWSDPALTEALADDIGRPVWLRRDVGGQQDLERSVLVTTEATRLAVEAELGADLDLRRFRTNVHLDLDAAAYAEQSWTGGTLRIGDVELELLHPCARCAIPTRDPVTQEKWAGLLRWLTRENGGLFGINARVRRGGAIAAGAVAEHVPG